MECFGFLLLEVILSIFLVLFCFFCKVDCWFRVFLNWYGKFSFRINIWVFFEWRILVGAMYFLNVLDICLVLLNMFLDKGGFVYRFFLKDRGNLY